MRRRISFLVVLLTILAMAVPSLALGTSLVYADDEQPRLDVTISALSPDYLGSSGTLTISGTVRNPGVETLPDVSVGLWRDATPLTTASQLWAADKQSGGGAVSLADTARVSLGELAPGATKKFTVSASLDPDSASEPLWLSQRDAAYRIGVEARSSDAVVGSARTTIANPGSTVSTAKLIALQASPGFNPLRPASGAKPTDLLDAAALSKDITARLEPLMKQAESSNVLIDPALLDQLNTLDTPQAASLVARIQQRATKPGAYRGLYNSPNVAAARANGGEAWLETASSVDQGKILGSLPLLVQAGTVSDEDVAALSPAKPVAVLAENLSSGPAEIAGLRVLASGSTAANSSEMSSLRARQLIFGRDKPLVTVVSKPITDPNWLESTSIDGLLTGPVVQAELAPIGHPDELPGVNEARRWVVFTGNSQNFPKTLGRYANAYFSSAFATPAERQTWLTKVLAPAKELDEPNAIQILATDTVTTSEKDNVLPVTIVNTTTSTAHVRVTFDSDNEQRVRIPDSNLVTVDAGEQLTVRVNPQSAANGPVPVRAQVVLENGEPIGQSVEFLVTATKVGNLAWVLIIASGAVLLFVTALRVRQVRRKASESAES